MKENIFVDLMLLIFGIISFQTFLIYIGFDFVQSKNSFYLYVFIFIIAILYILFFN